jgi:heptosyltransferase-2
MLIVALWVVGDLTISIPFLRKACEEFDVTLLAKPFALDFQPRFWHDVKVIPFTAPWTSFNRKYRLLSWPWHQIASVTRALHREHFDVALSARWDPRDHFLLKLTGAKKRLGFPRAGSQFLLTDPLPLPDHLAHQYEYWRVLARALNLDLESRDQLSFPNAGNRRTIFIHTGAAQPVRIWPLEQYRLLIAQLRGLGHTVRVICNPDQQRWWQNAGEADVAAPQTIRDLLVLLDQGGLFIGNDSGPGHLAAFCGLPTFTLFGPQVSEWWVPLHPAAEIMEGKACPYKPCSDSCRFATAYCLWDVTVAEVWPKVRQFVERHLNRPAPPPAELAGVT